MSAPHAAPRGALFLRAELGKLTAFLRRDFLIAWSIGSRSYPSGRGSRCKP